jgi:hypothetical protein
MDKKLKTWLDNKLDNYTESKYEIPIKAFQTSGKYDREIYEVYYDKNDIDEQMNTTYIENEKYIEPEKCDPYDCQQSIEEYGEKKMLMPQNTKRAHCSYLYKLLLDTTIEKNMYIATPKISGSMIEYIEYPIFDKSMKEKFYSFCMENSLK